MIILIGQIPSKSDSLLFTDSLLKVYIFVLFQGVGNNRAAVHAAMQTPCAALHPRIAAGTAAPPVPTPATTPPAAQQATQTALQPE